ncbi:hypothetical protein F5X99DRAFT_397439 [Biscogniauxia marginata]|nr:hypothetical protein F5X99DRAFT_397439 [Biscogniauxia marginata]
MTPHLHPRSRMTSSLFATTLAASFIVVGLPHILPCPAPRVSYADSSSEVAPDGTRRPRRRRPRPQQQAAEVKDSIVQFDGASEDLERLPNSGSGGEERGTMARRERECPVPKPGRVIGDLMGFGSNDNDGKKAAIASRSDGVDGKGGPGG